MMFQVQTSRKRKASIGRKKKQDNSYKNYEEVMANIEVLVVPEEETDDEATADTACQPPKK